MILSRRAAIGWAALLLLATGALVWVLRQPSPGAVRTTVITTIQEEAPASFLVTGTLEITTEVRIDSSVYLTPDWLTRMLQASQPGLLSWMEGTAHTTIRVPGRVSYGMEAALLTEDMVDVRRDGSVWLTLPPLAVHSVEPDLSRLEVQMGADGWLRLAPSDAHDAVRQSALAAVDDAFRQQARAHIDSATQPRIHTADALATLLRPALAAAGVAPDAFHVRINDRLTYTASPSADDAGRLPLPADDPE